MKGFLKHSAKKVLFTVVTAGILLTSCAQQPPQTTTTTILDPAGVGTTTTTQDPATLSPQVGKVVVSALISSLTQGKNYATQFNEALIDAVCNTYERNDLVSVDVEEFTIDEDGKIEIKVQYMQSGHLETDHIEFCGDTRGFDAFYGLGKNRESYLAFLIVQAGTTPEAEIEKKRHTV